MSNGDSGAGDQPHSQDTLADITKVTSELVNLAALDLIAKMQPSKVPAARTRAAMYLNVVECFQACLLLVRQNMETHAALHVRSMLETYVNMTMLRKDAKHLGQMDYDKVDGQLKLCKELLDDPYLSADSIEKLNQWRTRLEPEREDLRKAGYQKKFVSHMIKDSGLPSLAVPYLNLNSIAHWDIGVLSERHEHEAGGLRVFAKTRPEAILPILSTAIQLMVMATEALEEVVKFPPGHYGKFFGRMNEAWGRMLQEYDKNGF